MTSQEKYKARIKADPKLHAAFRERVNEQQRQWRRANPEKTREYSKRYSKKLTPAQREAKRLKEAQWRERNPERALQNSLGWRSENRDKVRDLKLRIHYGIDLQDYGRMLESQNGVCAVCARPETQKQKGRVRALSVDHCHRTGKIRGLLCAGCNSGIGYFRDDPKIIASAIEYLSKPVI